MVIAELRGRAGIRPWVWACCIVLFAALPCIRPGLSEAREVRLGIGSVTPPYVLKDKGTGVEVDVIRRALEEAGHTAVFVFLSNPRLMLELKSGRLDGVAVNTEYRPDRGMALKVFPSSETVRYKNFVISLKKNGVTVNSVSDLRGKRIVAFFHASKYLGDAYLNAVRGNPWYKELSDQSLHAGMLYAGRIDLLVSDKLVFEYWRNKLIQSPKGLRLDTSVPLVYHDLFPPSPRIVLFRDEGLRDAFDRGLEALRKRGEIKAIMDQYTGGSPD